MAWQVALVVDTKLNDADLGILLGMMPVWALTTQVRQMAASDLRTLWDQVWAPEPALTLFIASPLIDSVSGLADQIRIIEAHHPNLNCVRIFGLSKNQTLTEILASCGYRPVQGTSYDGLAFAKPMEGITHLREVNVDFQELTVGSTDWQTMNYFYDTFFRAVGAPSWHGRNPNALIDSIEGGAINEIEVPYRVVIRNLPRGNESVRGVVEEFADLVRLMQLNGCPVFLTVAE